MLSWRRPAGSSKGPAAASQPAQGLPSTMTSVIAVVGGGSFGSTSWGSTTAIPRNVANQIRPSLAFQHAG